MHHHHPASAPTTSHPASAATTTSRHGHGHLLNKTGRGRGTRERGRERENLYILKEGHQDLREGWPVARSGAGCWGGTAVATGSGGAAAISSPAIMQELGYLAGEDDGVEDARRHLLLRLRPPRAAISSTHGRPL
jgi:hypothetical protein